jgi:hypothetical protein
MDFGSARTLATCSGAKQAPLVIRKATYGKGDQLADVTDKARQAVAAGALSLTAGNELSGSDPAPNTPKELRVEFTFGGKDDIAIVAEGATLTIGSAAPWIVEAPAGTRARFLRVERPNGEPLRIHELRISGRFE